jgi:hypothetical protein
LSTISANAQRKNGEIKYEPSDLDLNISNGATAIKNA